MAATRHKRQSAELEMKGGKSKRQRIWEAVRLLRDSFSISSISSTSKIEAATVQTYLLALNKGGYIAALDDTAVIGQEKILHLIRDNGLEAPRLQRDGQPVQQGRAQEQMWRTMRILGRDFNHLELAELASTDEVRVAETAANDYLRNLSHAGYLIRQSKGKGHGNGGTPSRYRFDPTRYSGPRPPMIQRTKSVYDPNLGKVVWQEAPDHDEL
ncbi:hypothetical protein [Chitinibacter sp. S2-10]|uniref:hypothetical protein n=1 Tax=Chitinibacter sp. S2-10 TaxID=3373597 RepID=UPI0039778CD3